MNNVYTDILEFLTEIWAKNGFVVGVAAGVILQTTLALIYIKFLVRKERYKYQALDKEYTTFDFSIKKAALEKDLQDLDVNLDDYALILRGFMQYPWVSYAKGYGGAKFFVKDKLFTVYVSDKSQKNEQLDS